jgi:hypothetical protein
MRSMQEACAGDSDWVDYCGGAIICMDRRVIKGCISVGCITDGAAAEALELHGMDRSHSSRDEYQSRKKP